MWIFAPYLYNASQVLDIGSLCVKYLLHHPVHIRLGSLYLISPLSSFVQAQLRLRMFCWSLATALPPWPPFFVHPSVISVVFLSASQLPGRNQLQPNRPGVPICGDRVTVRGGDKGGAAAQRAVTVPGGGRGGGGAVADGPFGTVGGGVHAVGGAVARGGVAEGRVAEAADWYVNGTQD